MQLLQFDSWMHHVGCAVVYSTISRCSLESAQPAANAPARTLAHFPVFLPGLAVGLAVGPCVGLAVGP
jgi:hypothetical protein